MIWRITANVRIGTTNKWTSIAELHETDESLGKALQKYVSKFATNSVSHIRFARYSRVTGEQDGQAGYVLVDYGDEKEKD